MSDHKETEVIDLPHGYIIGHCSYVRVYILASPSCNPIIYVCLCVCVRASLFECYNYLCHKLQLNLRNFCNKIYIKYRPMKEFLIKPQSYILYNLKLYYFVGLVETSNERNVDIDIQPHSCQHFCHLLSVPPISIAFNCPSWLEQEQAHNELTY